MQTDDLIENAMGLNVKIVPSGLENCPRCRLYVSKNSDELCVRCNNAVQLSAAT